MNSKLLIPVIVLCLSASSCKMVQLRRVRVEPSPVTVDVQVIREEASISQRSYVGVVEPAKEATVSALNSGTLDSLPVSQGQKVREGEVLFRIYSQPVRSSWEAAHAVLNQANDALKRARNLYEHGSIADVKIVELETKVAQAKAAAAAADASLEDCYVRAPFSGRISEILVTQGERVGLAQPVLRLIDEYGLQISISVPEGEMPGMQPGSRARVEFPSLDGKSVRASLKDRGLVAGSLSHSYKCSLSLRSQPAGLMSGMVCRVYMDSDNVRGIVIPADIIKLDSEGKYVWTVEGGTVQKTRIVPGGYSGKGVIVSKGLSEGDILIIRGASKVSSGMKVNVR